MTDARDIVELIEELQELGEHPCRAELPFGATLREASAALASLRKQLEDARSLPTDDGWEDIATAPRDGTVVWAYGTISGDWGYTPDRKDMAKAVYHSNRWCFAQPMGRHDPSTWQPTHWRPLPAPPSD